MIIVVCTDDTELLRVAERQAEEQPEIYGQCHRVFGGRIPSLARTENLFITAHGAKRGDDGNPVIGDAAEAFFLNAVQTFEGMAEIIPADYAGNTYISACESADKGGDFSFAEVFKAQIQGHRAHAGKVYGQKGGVGLRVPPPTDRGWVQA